MSSERGFTAKKNFLIITNLYTGISYRGTLQLLQYGLGMKDKTRQHSFSGENKVPSILKPSEMPLHPSIALSRSTTRFLLPPTPFSLSPSSPATLV